MSKLKNFIVETDKVDTNGYGAWVVAAHSPKEAEQMVKDEVFKHHNPVYSYYVEEIKKPKKPGIVTSGYYIE